MYPRNHLGRCLIHSGDDVSFKVVIAGANQAGSERWQKAFTKAYPQYTFFSLPESETDIEADYAVVWRPPGWLFSRGKGLRAVFNLGAGVDGLLRLPELPTNLPVIRLEDAGMARQMAEYVVHGLTNVTRQFDHYQQQQTQANWRVLPAVRPRDWPVGVLGLGTIGSQVASAIAALGYPVLGWSRSERNLPGIQSFHGADSLNDFLAQTRVLVNILPLTPDTHGILNRQTLGRLLPGSYLINVGRGEHLVEEDLLPLIDSGKMQGALLDVFRTEPLPTDHAFWAHPAVRVTPHIAAITLEDEAREQIINKIITLEQGGQITGVVPRDRGY